VILDRFGQENYNTVLLARSGAGKSYLAKLEASGFCTAGAVFVIDPRTSTGAHHRGRRRPPAARRARAVTLNPLDLPVAEACRRSMSA